VRERSLGRERDLTEESACGDRQGAGPRRRPRTYVTDDDVLEQVGVLRHGSQIQAHALPLLPALGLIVGGDFILGRSVGGAGIIADRSAEMGIDRWCGLSCVDRSC
jgi:hypothetical protein